MSLKRSLFWTVLFVFSGVWVLSKMSTKVWSVADHIVISEIQVAGDGADDEFVELYNPTDSDVDLSGWSLTRINSGGTESNLDASMSGTIAAHGYYLIANPTYNGSVVADEGYSNTGNGMTVNDAIVLSDDSDVLVDEVGMGTPFQSETSPVTAPDTHGSVVRKALPTSDLASMMPGGADALEGNGEDSGDNSADFVAYTLADPQNSDSPTELLADADHTALITMDGSQEVPPVVTDATGLATVELNLTNNALSYEINYEGLSGAETAAHIHGMAGVGEEASPLHTLPSGLPKHGEWPYDEGQESEVVTGMTYLNVHTAQNTDGEIRGQVDFGITPTTTPTEEVTPTPTEEITPTPTEEVTPTPTEEVTPTPTEEVTPTPTEEVTPTPTEEVTPTPTEEVTPTPTEEVTPTPTEEVTPTPTEEATPTPTEEVTPTPTEEGTPTPTEEVTPTPTEEVTPTPTEEPTPTDKPGHGHGHHKSTSFDLLNVVCTRSYLTYHLFGRTIRFPHVTCMPAWWY